VSKPTTQIAQIEYDAARELLTGVIGQARPFHVIAYSGGSRGHKPVSAAKRAASHAKDPYLYSQSSALSSHMATTREVKNKDGAYIQRGGTLPPGHYTCHYIARHGTFGECIQLLRTADAVAIHSPFSPRPIPHGRGNDFFIHGSGPKGSDGCIVPANKLERLRLNQAVKAFPGKVILLVKHVSYMLPAELGGQLA
jgi:hypothetical protein